MTEFKTGLIFSIVFWVIAFCIGLGAYEAFGARTDLPSVPQAKWQSVFLQNGQVYFGHMKEASSAYVALSDVYYLRSAADLQQSGSLNLVKLGGELHGPEDTIYIPKASILFWENLKGDSKVVQSIQATSH
jgi:hypothetical protein